MVNDIEVKIKGSQWQEPESPSGSTKTAACLQRSEPEHGRPESFLCDLWAEACHHQPNEGVAGKVRESDPSIVVGDGNTDHKAKGRAEEQRQQRSDAAARRPRKSVSSSLLAIGQKAKAEPGHRFEDLYGMINVEPKMAFLTLNLEEKANVDRVFPSTEAPGSPWRGWDDGE